MTPFYYELSIKASSHFRYIAEFISDIWDEGFEEGDNTLIIRSSESLEDIEWGVREFVKELSLHTKKPVDVTFSLTQKENKDWIESYKKSIEPVSVGDFYIRASWHTPSKEKTEIIIDPALAFGSGHHESTKGCLSLISDMDLEDKECFDIGCGSGVLSIAAYKKGAKIYLCDTDETAVAESKKNLLLNGIREYRLKEGSASSFQREFDAVFANISADILDALYNEIKKRVKSGGFLIASGIIKDKLERVKGRYKDFTIQNILQLNDWFSILFKKG